MVVYGMQSHAVFFILSFTGIKLFSTNVLGKSIKMLEGVPVMVKSTMFALKKK